MFGLAAFALISTGAPNSAVCRPDPVRLDSQCLSSVAAKCSCGEARGSTRTLHCWRASHAGQDDDELPASRPSPRTRLAAVDRGGVVVSSSGRAATLRVADPAGAACAPPAPQIRSQRPAASSSAVPARLAPGARRRAPELAPYSCIAAASELASHARGMRIPVGRRSRYSWPWPVQFDFTVSGLKPISEGHPLIMLWRGPVQIFVWRGPAQILCTHSQRKFRWRSPVRRWGHDHRRDACAEKSQKKKKIAACGGLLRTGTHAGGACRTSDIRASIKPTSEGHSYFHCP
jgi:hypothetical protein